MAENDVLGETVKALQAGARAGESSSSLLRLIQEMVGKADCKLISVQCFHRAFGGGVAAISPIAGWVGFGGDLGDAQVDAFLAALLDAYRAGQE